MSRIASEKLIVEKMIDVYCQGHKHVQGELCPDCTELVQYAHNRLDLCQFGEDKGFCKVCPIHCYNREMRPRIREVMRYSGPRIFWYHPRMAASHLVSSGIYLLKKKKPKRRT
jgi:hypothetical protein